MATTSPLGESFPIQIGSRGIPEISVPVVLLRVLLQATGTMTLDNFDLMSDEKGHLEVMKHTDPFVYKYRWVDE